MSTLGPDELPLPQRLALSYAPRAARDPWLAFLLFDARLAGFVAQASEPMLAQMRIAWWRDVLRKPPGERPRGEPLLAALGQAFPGQEAKLIACADGWERLVADPPLNPGAIDEFAAGRASGLLAVAHACGFEARDEIVWAAGRRWALADLAAHSADARERAEMFERAGTAVPPAGALPRAMRPLAVLDALARRAVASGEGPLLRDWRSGMLAFRVGLLGR